MRKDLDKLTALGRNVQAVGDYDPSVLDAFDNQHPARDYWVTFTCPEFTTLCPKTGQPDFATLTIRYIPAKRLVESKSLKLYLFGFRNHGDFHEDVVNVVYDDIWKLLRPKYLEVYGKFDRSVRERRRGGVLPCARPPPVRVLAGRAVAPAGKWKFRNSVLRRAAKKGKIVAVKKKLKYKRILLKLSGEVLANRETGECIDPAKLAFMAARVKKIHALGCQVGIVLGGGNIFRGLTGSAQGVNRVTGDSMGMLATIINGLAMMNALEAIGVPTRVMTSIEMPKLAEPFIQRKAIRHFEKGRVVVFAGGTGNPYFSTDSAAALRASEIGADVLLKATKVDGIYTADPKKDPKAKKYGSLRYETALEKRLKVMDAAAFALCMDNGIPIVVFDFFDGNALLRVVRGEAVGTLVSDT